MQNPPPPTVCILTLLTASQGATPWRKPWRQHSASILALLAAKPTEEEPTAAAHKQWHGFFPSASAPVVGVQLHTASPAANPAVSQTCPKYDANLPIICSNNLRRILMRSAVKCLLRGTFCHYWSSPWQQTETWRSWVTLIKTFLPYKWIQISWSRNQNVPECSALKNVLRKCWIIAFHLNFSINWKKTWSNF